jgi:hypothetical protein
VQEVAVIQAASEHVMHEWTERVRPFLSVVARGDRPVEEEQVKLDDSTQRILGAMPPGEIRKRATLKAVRLNPYFSSNVETSDVEPCGFPLVNEWGKTHHLLFYQGLGGKYQRRQYRQISDLVSALDFISAPACVGGAGHFSCFDSCRRL